IEERISANQELVGRVRNMSGTDERRLSRSIREADSDESRRDRAGTVRKIREIHRGNQNVISELQFEEVNELFETSLGGGGGGSTGTRKNPSSYALESVMEGAEEELSDRATKFRDEFSTAIDDGENSVSVSIDVSFRQ
ncbi:MAG: hypothetical protein ABEI86_04185, partial [Halobacteriaceae archaeon]